MKYFVLSIDFEEWFHSDWFNPKEVIARHFGGKIPETDLRRSVRHLLELFDDYSIKTTFFCLLRTSQRYPEVLKTVVESGHEIAFHGIDHQNGEDEEQFRDDLNIGKRALEELSGSKVIGYRAPNFKIPSWAFEALSDSGFIYDSSLIPCLRIPGWYGSARTPTHPYKIFTERSHVLEFPLTVFPFLRLPGSGGWFLRNFGLDWVKTLFRLHLRQSDLAVLYLHPWEVSDENPLLPEIPFHVFRRTGKWTLESLRSLIETFRKDVHFTSFQGYLEDKGLNV
jgi:polysaccharide deacetylase family protein (PEP-CTERM system associated)